MADKINDWEEVPTEAINDWEEVSFGPKKPGMLESGLRGAAQGLGMGFADEITGALESTAGSLGLVPDKTYEQARDESRANYIAAEKANPLTYGAAQLGGGVASLAIPGLNVAKGAGLATTVGKTALQGALTGLGSSEADNAGDLAKDAITGGLVGGGAGVLGSGGVRLAESIAPKAANVVQGASNFMKDKGGKILERAGDVAEAGSVVYGGFTGDWRPAGAIVGAKRFGGATTAKMAAAGLEKLPDILRSAPEMLGKYARPLVSAMERGGSSLGATHYVLQSTDPEYRKMLDEMQGQE